MAGTFNTIHLIRSVDLFTLKLFLTVMEERQVGRAAARENIAASAATKRIQDLEEIVGAALFERNPRGVVPTTAGVVLARHVAQIFGTFEDIRRDFSEFTEGVRGTVRIASTGGLISQYVSREIAEFARSFPQVDIDLRECANSEVVRVLAAGEVDVGIFIGTPGLAEDELDSLLYRTDRLIVVVPTGHPLAQRPHVKALDLFGHNLIAIGAATSLMASVRQAAAQAGVDFKPKYTVSSVYAATGLVRANLGVTIQPDGMLTAPDLDFVRVVPLDEPWATRNVRFGTPGGRSLTAATRNFVSQLMARPG
jgi:DNA-binding transcriptional LysR family regulator